VSGRGFHTITLGCKLNQFDSAGLEAELVRRGYRPTEGPRGADVVILNTCTVTGNADAEARKRIRQVRRVNQDGLLLVTGCYAELDAGAVAGLPGVDRVFGNREKPRIAEILNGLGVLPLPPALTGPTTSPLGLREERTDRGCDGFATLPDGLHFGDRARAFLKVQEGCDLVCSYCIIPRVRGASRSVPPDRLEKALARLRGAGYHEIVLTGVNTGDYGKDLQPRLSLAALLERLLRAVGPARIRLNSLEPLTVSDEILHLMACEPRLAPHLQVPLQSGSEPILRSMRRNYRLATYLQRLESLRAAVPDAGIGADVIVGFPGETEADFEATLRFIARSPLNYLHVFPWSPRPGTPAAALPDRVPAAVVRERSSRLRGLGAELSRRFRRGFVGRSLDAVVLGPREDGLVRALTGNFIEVTLAPPGPRRGSLVRVEVTSVEGATTRAEVVGAPGWASSD
jgi:threonylcarbamoyladenosine tRNA methylthiotransferase MtaB